MIMSRGTNIQTTEIQERSSQATKRLYQALGYESLKSADLKYVALALAEVAADEILINPDFANKIKRILDSVFPKKDSKESRSIAKKQEPANSPIQKTSKKRSPIDSLIPLKSIDMRIINPYASPDPYLLYDVFGREQLEIALKEFTLPTLREMTASIEAKHVDGPKPNKSKKDSMIQFILDMVEKSRATDGLAFEWTAQRS